MINDLLSSMRSKFVSKLINVFPILSSLVTSAGQKCETALSDYFHMENCN